MDTATGFHQWYTIIRYNYRIISTELIYLRSVVVLVYGVYKYTAVDVNTPYRRFKLILWCFLLLYMWYTPRIFYLYIFICICPRYFIYVYIHIYLTPIFICICVHILIHIFVFSRHYIVTAHVFATTCDTASNQRTDVRFNTFKIFHLIEYFR